MKHKKILDNLALAIFIVDEELHLNYLNPAGEEFLSTGARHATNRPITDFISDIEGEFIPHIQDSIRSGHPITEREVSIKRLGGGEMTINCVITPMWSLIVVPASESKSIRLSKLLPKIKATLLILQK